MLPVCVCVEVCEQLYLYERPCPAAAAPTVAAVVLFSFPCVTNPKSGLAADTAVFAVAVVVVVVVVGVADAL